MIVDSHVHLKHGDAARTEYSADEIVRVMDAVGIAKSVVFAMSTTTRRSIEFAEKAVASYPDRLIPYVYALPSYERAVLPEVEQAVSRRGFRGIKIHAGECKLAEYIVDPVLELAGAHGVPCLIDFSGRAADAERIARSFPQTKLIIAHLGKYLCTDVALIDRFIRIAEAHAQVTLDISGVVTSWKIEDAVRRIGSGRVLFGTDGPHRTPDTVSYARLAISQIEALTLTEEERADLLGGTLARLIGIG